MLGFDARERLEAFLSAVRRVIGRHDVLRSAVVWQGLREPVQVVVREAVLPVREVVLAGGEDPVAALLAVGADPLDIGSAPLLRVFIAAQPEGGGRWLALLQVHHLVQDHTGLEVLMGEVAGVVGGAGGGSAGSAAVQELRGAGPAGCLAGRARAVLRRPAG